MTLIDKYYFNKYDIVLLMVLCLTRILAVHCWTQW